MLSSLEKGRLISNLISNTEHSVKTRKGYRCPLLSSPPRSPEVLQIAENPYFTGQIGPGLQQDFQDFRTSAGLHFGKSWHRNPCRYWQKWDYQDFRTSFQEWKVILGLSGRLRPAPCLYINTFMKTVTLKERL